MYLIFIKIISSLFLILIIFKSLRNIKLLSFAKYNHYLDNCRNLKKFNRIKIVKNIPYISICLPVLNMDKYIEKVIYSILNQSFQDFEIILVNDNSNDKTESIIKEIISKDNRIKYINHINNSGVYNSRVDAFKISKGKYILLMDPDDMLLNPKLFERLYNFNLKYNLDIIEFTTLVYYEKYSILKIRKNMYHYHNIKGIIYQPQLSDIFFYHPIHKNISSVQCRNIWNKIIRREVLLNTINYIGNEYYKEFFITAEDTIINILSLHFANNYTNLNILGYMYNIREKSMCHGKADINKKILFNFNHLLYLKKFNIYIKDFNKNMNFLFYELIKVNKLLIELNNITKKYNTDLKNLYNDLLENPNCSVLFKQYIKNITLILKY